MKSTIIMIVLCIYCLFLWAFMAFAWRKGYKEWREKRDMRSYSVKAIVVDKREIKDTTDSTEPWQRIVTFGISGRNVEYTVSDEVYRSIHVGQTGTLHITKKEFDSFIADAPREIHDDLYDRIVKG